MYVQRSFRGLTNILTTSVVVSLVFTMTFVSGYLFGRAEPAGGPLSFLDILQPATARASQDGVPTSDEQLRFRVLWEAWQIVERDFYDKSQVDHQKLIYGAIKGMVDAVGDPYTVYQTPSQRELNDTDLRGAFDGIGIQVDMKENRLTVVAPIEGSPAEAAGFRPGDVVLAVDGKSLSGTTLNDTVGLIRGQRGTPVTLTVLRPGTADPFPITVVRAEIKLKSVRVRMLDDQVGYLRISSFSGSTGTEMANGVKDLLGQQARGLIVDLRDNPGGYVSTSVEASAQFVDPGTVVLYQKSGNGDVKTYRTEGGGTASQVPVVVLINKGSASASEIMAGALRDNGRAILVGEQTFGKGTVQNVHELSDKSGLRVTTAQWLTPAERPIQGVGLLPDRVVEMPATATISSEASRADDPQLDAAVRHILGG
ncbi:MAG TPA: S41 family peptidase [Chloroflexota bacterium]|nr:S41 family peptidase [Chloroflexota bacterium]